MSLVGFKARNHPQQSAKPMVDDRALPQEDFHKLNKRFRFTIDAAASASNTKLPRFWSVDDDALSKDWGGERVYCNPPYSNIRPWVKKAWEQIEAEIIVMLLPANRTEQGWWQDLVERFRDTNCGFRVEFLRGRQRFLAPGEETIKPNSRPPFGCCLLIWNDGDRRMVSE